MIPPNISSFVTENMSNVDVSAAHGMIDAEIEKLRENIRVLQRYRNELCPVNRLPRDILLIIFHLLIPKINIEGRHPGLLTNLLNVTHVSQRWRLMALESSGLWSRIACPPLRFAEEMIARSRDACLEVDVRGNNVKRFLPCLLGQLTRIRVLAIDLTFRNVGEPTLEELDRPAPLLETLSLLHVVLPRRLFAGQSQKLKQVYLRQCAFRWSPELSTLFHNLITLQVNECDVRSSSGLPSLLVILEAMPLLRKLQLDYPCIPDNPDIATFGPPVVMPSLVSLEFVDSAKECVQFLEHIIFPKIQNARFGIHASYHYDPTESIRPSDFCDTMRKSFQHLQDEQPCVFIDFDFDTKLCAYTAVPREYPNGFIGEIEPQLQLEIEYWPTFLPELPRIFHTPYVRAISLGYSDYPGQEVLGEFLASFPHVQECTIYRDDVSALLRTLAIPRRNEETGMDQLLFPNLKVLSFKHLSNQDLFRDLLNLLEMRFDNGRCQKLTELRIHRCHGLGPWVLRAFTRFANIVCFYAGPP
ncbi:hypothetical protein JAAARDRAFT_202216 [Jaapia argillacea MUCL 33604]|uniref:F-box domain-containing protein n=1 Tax=Jaapia argillacea MUCL 33604 TaxID=933084 RepID=A0A067QN53_9AGAM|nr:hypothetical protein JAAARDRAFT_202216 [Jaapia argillacea MUCL 33604]